MSLNHHNPNYIKVPQAHSVAEAGPKSFPRKSRYPAGEGAIPLHIPDVTPEVDKGKNADNLNKRKELEMEKKMKKWRLIIRNLSFNCTKEDFDAKMTSFGPVYDTVFPIKDKRCTGFAFVQFRDQKTAEEVIKEFNMKPFKGRPVAVDYAIPKDTYESAENGTKTKKEEILEPETSEITNVKGIADAKRLSDDKDSDSSNAKNSESDNDASESEDESIAENKKGNKTKPVKTFEPPAEDAAVKEGRTLFIRNLSFDTADKDLKTYFSTFGEIKYALVSKYKGTQHSRGNGFVQFLNLGDAEKCLNQSNDEDCDGLLLGGRRIYVCKALPRDDAKKMEETRKEKKPKDVRNLHLLRVGIIRQGTSQSNSMSDNDANLRLKIEAANREKIKNLHVFVSPVRLCIHNLPTKLTDKELSKLCNLSVTEPCIIEECRIMRDLSRISAEGLGKSRGFGFVKFAEHKFALECLQKLNNNSETFSTLKRPIVEFSLENRNALNAKAKRTEKSKIKLSDKPVDNKKKVLKSKLNRSRKSKNLVPLTDVDKTKLELVKGGVKPLPSHMGPKIRHKRKSQDPGMLKKKKKKFIQKKKVSDE